MIDIQKYPDVRSNSINRDAPQANVTPGKPGATLVRVR